MDYRPRFDVVYRTIHALKAGETVGDDHDPNLTAEILPAMRLSPDAPLPAGLARGCRLTRDVTPGTLLSGAMVQRPAESILWALRDEQDRHFANG
jgi:predicted homoserine dehydrogenase-like protein